MSSSKENNNKDEKDWRDDVNWAEVLDNTDVPLWVLAPEFIAAIVILAVLVITLLISVLCPL